MKEIARFVQKLRGMNHVIRWNMHVCLRKENIAEHSMWVATFAAILAPAADRNALVFAAVTHDYEESITGDLPALVKRATPDWDSTVKRAEAELFRAAVGPEEREIQDAFIAARHLAETNPVVKIADLFSALMFARMENELGNMHFKAIENELIHTIVKAAYKPHLDEGIKSRTLHLLETLGFDANEGVPVQDDISHF